MYFRLVSRAKKGTTMPDHLDENGFVRPEIIDRRAAARAIEACDLCDSDGYRGGMVCDHIDHTEAAKRGMAMVRKAMGWTS